MPLVSTENFFDGFGFNDKKYADKFKWQMGSVLDERELECPPRRRVGIHECCRLACPRHERRYVVPLFKVFRPFQQVSETGAASERDLPAVRGIAKIGDLEGRGHQHE